MTGKIKILWKEAPISECVFCCDYFLQNLKLFLKRYIFRGNPIERPLKLCCRFFNSTCRSEFKSFFDQKQPSKSVLRKRCSENMQHIYKRTPMLKSHFVMGVLAYVCYISLGHFFLRTPLECCFCSLLMTSIFVIIAGIFCHYFKCNYLKPQIYFAAFLLHFWNLH